MNPRTFGWIGAEFFRHGASFVPDPQDVMLVSYPKSGNTWVRALVSQLVGAQHSLKEMDHLVPDVYSCRGHVLRKAHRFPCAGRLIKSHESFRPTYKRVIYLVRDPRDVCVSYYHYLADIQRTVDASSTSLNEFVDPFLSGKFDDYGTWGEHTGSWLAAETADLLLIRYEDLISDAADCLARICGFLGLEHNDEAIRTAVESCSLDRLRAKEKSERTSWQPMRKADVSASFFRAGGSGGRSDLDKRSLDAISDRWRDEMMAMGYIA